MHEINGKQMMMAWLALDSITPTVVYMVLSTPPRTDYSSVHGPHRTRSLGRNHVVPALLAPAMAAA